VVAKLADVVDAGVPVTLVGGNHDAWTGPFLRERVGIRTVSGPVEMEIAGRRALVAHGDGVGTGDFRYRALKKVIRSRGAIGAFRVLHPDLGRSIARLASRTEHRAASDEEARSAARGRAAYIQGWGEEVLRERPELDLVLAGHAHMASLVEVSPGRFYINSGDWIGRERSYVTVSVEGRPEIRRWDG
jgi:UDP-2,3-diacylglucosamine hydrolase